MNKPILVLEPSLTAVRCLKSERGIHVEEWREAFLKWFATFQAHPWIIWLRCEATQEDMSILDRLEELLPETSSHSVKDFRQALILLMDRCPTVENHLCSPEMDFLDCECDPPNALKYKTSDFREMAQKMFRCLGKWKSKSPRRKASCGVVIRRFSPNSHVTVRFGPNGEEHISLIFDLPEFLDQIDKYQILQILGIGLEQLDDSLVLTAIRLKLRQMLKQTDRLEDWERDLPGFFIGTKFSASFHRLSQKMSLNNQNLILEECCKVILGVRFENKPRIFETYLGSGEQKSRYGGKDKGWRWHIDNTMYRLEYWERPDGPELARLEVKPERVGRPGAYPNLPEGERARAVGFQPRAGASNHLRKKDSGRSLQDTLR